MQIVLCVVILSKDTVGVLEDLMGKVIYYHILYMIWYMTGVPVREDMLQENHLGKDIMIIGLVGENMSFKIT